MVSRPGQALSVSAKLILRCEAASHPCLVSYTAAALLNDAMNDAISKSLPLSDLWVGASREQEEWETSSRVSARCPDDRILSCALYFLQDAPGASDGSFRVALATGDMNLRLKATMRGVRSELLSALVASELAIRL